MSKSNTQSLVILSIFSGIIIILAFTPIGFIQLGFIKATIIHVPVIVGSILLGPKKGAFLGFLFGLTSLISNTLTPAVMSFAFSPLIPIPGRGRGSILALVICFLPRILTGTIPYYVYSILNKILKNKFNLFTFSIAGVIGSMTNTLLVMNGIYIIFKDAYAMAREIPVSTVYKAILSVIFINGIPEAIVAGVITASLCQVLIKNKQVKDVISKL